MNIQEMMDYYMNEGYSRILSSARVCQDIVLKAISEGPLGLPGPKSFFHPGRHIQKGYVY
jgi:hypothetical protein